MKHSTLTAIALALATIGVATPAFAASGGAGGGGAGGGNRTGGAGGGAVVVAAPAGAVRTSSAVASCSAGSTMTVTVSKGIQKRVSLQIAAVGAVLPSGNTTLGGTWEVQLSNITAGQPVTGFATSLGFQTPSVLWTTVGGTVPVGVSNLSFTAVRRDSGSTLSPTPAITPVLETCTAIMAVVAN